MTSDAQASQINRGNEFHLGNLLCTPEQCYNLLKNPSLHECIVLLNILIFEKLIGKIERDFLF